MTYCQRCGASIEQHEEKALGEPRDQAFQTVWATANGDWICPDNDGNEHEPGGVGHVESVGLAIFAINTWMHPDASSAADIDYLEKHQGQVRMSLNRIKGWLEANPEWEERA